MGLRKTTALLICIVLALTAFIGCDANVSPPAPTPTQEPTPIPTPVPTPMPPLVLRHYHGHVGGSPTFIVHLQDQNAFDIIRRRLESAGLVFGAELPEYALVFPTGNVYIDLYDNSRNVAIIFIDWERNNQHFYTFGGHRFSVHVAQALTEITSDMVFGAFYNAGKDFGPSATWCEETEININNPNPSEEAMEEARLELTAYLLAQADAFIAMLRDTGVLR